MTRILLTGAGFTKNWGGLVASEFFSRLLGETLDDDVRAMLLKHRNFETVMAGLQGAYAHSKSDNDFRRLARFTSAVLGIFNGMHSHLARIQFEFDNDVNHSVTRFLQRFDAIFTLNQDGLLEMQPNSLVTRTSASPAKSTRDSRRAICTRLRRLWNSAI